jgi:hypothetical protein
MYQRFRIHANEKHDRIAEILFRKVPVRKDASDTFRKLSRA